VGFFATGANQAASARNRPSDDLLRRLGCVACPLNKAELNTPKMAPTGSDEPLIYCLGEAPGCVSGDTFIEVAYRDKARYPNGIPISELEGRSGFNVYSFDVITQELVLGWVTKVWKSGRKRVYRVIYEWRDYAHNKKMTSSIKVTENHPFLLKRYIPHDPFGSKRRHNKNYLSIENGLSVGDGLQPFVRSYGRYPAIGTSSVSMRLEGRFLLGQKIGRSLSADEDCHHDDENKLNDAWKNLKLLTHEEHARVHANVANMLGTEEGRRNHAEVMASVSYRQKLSTSMKVYLSDPDNFKKRREQLLEAGEKTRFGIVNYRGMLGKRWITNGSSDSVLKPGESIPEGWWMGKTGTCAGTRWITNGLVNRRVSARVGIPDGWFYGKSKRVDNHRVVSIEYVGIEDVFDMEVEEYHNFAANGIFVHNSAEDREGRQFVGPSGQFLRPFFPGRLRAKVRWNNSLNCRPPNNRDPDKTELECCRPRIEEDIERTRPIAVFGFGAVPLSWADKPGGISMWRGRRFPIQIGRHACWYYPMQHPAFFLRAKKGNWPSDEEIAFRFDIGRALEDVERGLPKPVVHTPEFARRDITCLTGRASKDLSYLLEFLEYASGCDVAGVDYETQNLRPYRRDSVILTRAVSVSDETVAFSWRHPEAGWSADAFAKIEKAWVRFLKSEAKKAVHNAAFEMEWDCYIYGAELAREVPWECTQTQAFVLDERIGDHKPGALALEFISLQHFGINIKKLTAGLNKQRMTAEPLASLLPYNGIDAKYHRLNYEVQDRRAREDGLVEVYREKLRQIPTVVLTQIKGMPTDKEVTKRLCVEYAGKIEEVLRQIQGIPEARQFWRMTGSQFNPGSPEDVVVMLRDILKTREGQEGVGWSTKEATLSKVDHPIAKGVLDYRKVAKLKSTYVDPLLPGSPIMYDDGLLHTNLNTCFTETGRLSSDEPNLQNIPVRTKEGQRVRRQFRSKIVASFDYGQIDARIIACGSRDPSYCKALWEDYDVHAEWARRLALAHPAFVGGKKFLGDKDVFESFRNKIKSVWVFALFYGAALRTTAGRLGVDEGVIKPLYDEFWKMFAGVKEWQETLIGQFEEYGYVQMLGGLRRRAPLGRGQIINTPVQGATNRIVMHAMNRLSETGDPLLQANIQIHDDLKFHFDRVRDFEDATPRIVDIMLDGSEFDWFCVPLVVDMKEGPNWEDMEKVGNFASHKLLNWPVRAREFS
jgi:uracil-DNA glycosylase family 4